MEMKMDVEFFTSVNEMTMTIAYYFTNKNEI